MNRTVVTILLLVFASFALASSGILYYTHQLPIEKKLTTTLYTYESYGAFDYVVTLKPNTIYNKTTLEPGEGPIFTKIADTLYVNFTYTFQGNKPANLTVNYDFSENLETTMVQKQIETAPPKTIYTTGTTADLNLTDIPPINISSVEDLVDTISKETAMTIITYNVTITIQMNIEANTAEGPVHESFAPQLAIRFKSSFAEGDIILIEGVPHSETGEITNIETIYQGWVNTLRYVFYILSGMSFAGLLVTILAYIRNRPTKPTTPEALIEEIIEPFKEIISEATQQPQFKEGFTKIPMTALEDIAKVADTLAKQIVHACKPPETHIFYVIDGTTLYEYTVTESSIIQKMKKEEEE